MLGMVMVIQIGGMVVHRTSTFLHIMATTTLSSSRMESDKDDTQNMIALARSLGRVQSEGQMTRKSSVASTANSSWSSENEGDADTIKPRHSRSVLNKISKNVRRKRTTATHMSVDRAFEKRFKQLQNTIKESTEDNPLDVNYIQKHLLGNRQASSITQQKTLAALKMLQIKEITDSTHV